MRALALLVVGIPRRTSSSQSSCSCFYYYYYCYYYCYYNAQIPALGNVSVAAAISDLRLV
jgi:hypothetical protein